MAMMMVMCTHTRGVCDGVIGRKGKRGSSGEKKKKDIREGHMCVHHAIDDEAFVVCGAPIYRASLLRSFRFLCCTVFFKPNAQQQHADSPPPLSS